MQRGRCSPSSFCSFSLSAQLLRPETQQVPHKRSFCFLPKKKKTGTDTEPSNLLSQFDAFLLWAFDPKKKLEKMTFTVVESSKPPSSASGPVLVLLIGQVSRWHCSAPPLHTDDPCWPLQLLLNNYLSAC